jgi:hypothetical protein
MRKIIFSFLILFAQFSQANTLDVTNSVVRIDNDDLTRSSFFVIDQDKDFYYLLGAGHAIHHICGGAGAIEVFCGGCDIPHSGSFPAKKFIPAKPMDFSDIKLDATFFHNGKAQRFEDVGTVLAYVYHGMWDEDNIIEDISLIRISKKETASYGVELKTLTLADDNTTCKSGDIIWTFGSPLGKWPSLIKGSVIEDKQRKKTLTFIPYAEFGRSGSPVLEYNCDRVIGVLIYNIEDRQATGAVPLWRIKKFLKEYEEGKKNEQSEPIEID